MKPVMKIKDDTVLEIYPSALRAAKENGLRANHITGNCRGEKYRQRVGGYVWRYA